MSTIDAIKDSDNELRAVVLKLEKLLPTDPQYAAKHDALRHELDAIATNGIRLRQHRIAEIMAS